MMVLLGTISPSAQGRLQPTRQRGCIEPRGHGPLLRRQAVVAIHADRPAHGLHERAGVRGHIREQDTAHREKAHSFSALGAVCHQDPVELATGVRRRVKGRQLVHRGDAEVLTVASGLSKLPEVLDQSVHARAPGHEHHCLRRVGGHVLGDGVQLRRAGLQALQHSVFAAVLALVHGPEVHAQVAVALQAPHRQAGRPLLVIPLQRLATERDLLHELPAQIGRQHGVRDAPRQRLWE
mmetsp:Transcript_76622/g.206556  ORF Transcript_76622/g.206556 Transcript_76622/m.206556 type:complete len:237 (-) Transcript_76622:3228-3938(-)